MNNEPLYKIKHPLGESSSYTKQEAENMVNACPGELIRITQMNKYAISQDEERYSSFLFDSKEEAIEQGKEEFDGEGFFVGEAVAPPQPETLFDVDDWLETVNCHEDYDVEWAEGWDTSTKEQRKELEDAVKITMAAWLDSHDLRPSFYNVINAVYIPSAVEQMRHENKD